MEHRGQAADSCGCLRAGRRRPRGLPWTSGCPHEATLRQWQEAAASALSAPKRRGRARQSPEAKRVVELERELRRKDAALAEMAALITLQKEARAIWGDEVDGTGTRSGT